MVDGKRARHSQLSEYLIGVDLCNIDVVSISCSSGSFGWATETQCWNKVQATRCELHSSRRKRRRVK
jgi:hypothetical protein